MATELRTIPLSLFKSMRDDKTLDVSPEIQRRAVWPPKSKMLLIDSLARGVPIGAVTLYQYKHDDGYDMYEVIDGKQRLSTFFEFIDSGFKIEESKILNKDEDDIADVGREFAEPFYNMEFKDLKKPEATRLLQYDVPVFVMTGTRDEAVQAFTRMNKNSYVLKPQEIRNAIYAKSFFLQTSEKISLNFSYGDIPQELGFVKMGVMSIGDFDRMQDVQFASELLALAINGDQNRRDSLNSFCQRYGSNTGAAAKEVKEASDRVESALSQIAEIFDDASPLGAFHFPKPCENDFYALVSAMLERGLFSRATLKGAREQIRDGLSEFRRQVALFVEAATTATVSEDVPDVVKRYGQTLLTGQLNSKVRRTIRRDAWIEVLNGIADPPVSAEFSRAIRELIWASSVDKECGWCHRAVVFEEFHAGHRVPKAKGGLATLANGRIEHAKCNQEHGAD